MSVSRSDSRGKAGMNWKQKGRRTVTEECGKEKAAQWDLVNKIKEHKISKGTKKLGLKKNRMAED